MAYDLSFSDEFFIRDDGECEESSERPTTVWQAIHSIQREQWEAIARDVFRVAPSRLDPETVLDRIRRTNTCSNLDSPVRVWIDDDGSYYVMVHDPNSVVKLQAGGRS